MIKKELVEFISNEADISIQDAEKFIKSFTETITSELSSGGNVKIVGFGSFYTQLREKRVGRNPKTGEELNIPSVNTLKFKAGKCFRDSVDV